MEVQHINVKIFARNDSEADLSAAIAVFHRWIQENACPELLIDVADYRHVPDGPGVMLIAHEANYSLDQTGGRLGLLYNRKKAEAGSTEDKLRQAYDAALAACKRLEAEPLFAGKLRFDGRDCEVIFNDRLLTPNTEETWNRLKPELERCFSALWGPSAFTLERIGEARERLRVRARAAVGLP